MGRGKGHRLALLTSVVLASAWIAGGAQAQDAGDGTSGRMNSIEGQIRTLQNELRAMRREQAGRDSQLKAAQAEAARAREDAQRATAAAQAVTVPPQAQSGVAPGGLGTVGLGYGPGAVPGYRNYANENAGQQNAAVIQGPGKGSFQVGGVTVTLGGFIEAAGFYRSRNEVADIYSSFNGIPFPQSPLAHEGEWRQSSRQSRIAMLVQGDIDPDQHLAGYFETDFLGAAPTANSLESNSYNLRLRQAYATYDNTRWGFHALGGQSWSLITLNKAGITPRGEAVPYTIDAQYVVGFDWARQEQFRVDQSLFNKKLWLGLSLESPQTNYYTGPNGLGAQTGTPNILNPGGAGFFSGTNYSDEIAPDVIAKVAADPGFGHYEVYGLARFMHDRVSVLGGGRNNTTLAGGGGAAMYLPITSSKKLFFRASALAGYGLGRYGSGQLPDAVVRPDGSPQPLPEVMALVGIEGSPIPPVDVYAYVGTEQLGRNDFTVKGKGYGYGNPLYVNTGCYQELSTLACTANTSGLVDGTLGAWWRFLSGAYGTAEVGAEYEYIRRSIFSGVGGSRGTDENIALVSFRYLPFQ